MSNKIYTPGARWRQEGQQDPHESKYDCMRSELTLGDLTDDELANEVFLKGDRTPKLEDIIAGTAKPPIVYLTAAKERIRWLSRQLHREPELVFAGVFKGKDIFVTPEVKEMVDYLASGPKLYNDEGKL